jgi:hypothetical protein
LVEYLEQSTIGDAVAVPTLFMLMLAQAPALNQPSPFPLTFFGKYVLETWDCTKSRLVPSVVVAAPSKRTSSGADVSGPYPPRLDVTVIALWMVMPPSEDGGQLFSCQGGVLGGGGGGVGGGGDGGGEGGGGEGGGGCGGGAGGGGDGLRAHNDGGERRRAGGG